MCRNFRAYGACIEKPVHTTVGARTIVIITMRIIGRDQTQGMVRAISQKWARTPRLRVVVDPSASVLAARWARIHRTRPMTSTAVAMLASIGYHTEAA